MRLAELRQFSNLGPLSLVLREEPDVRSALELLIRYEHTFNEAMRLRMTERNELAALSVAFDLGEEMSCRQSLELAVGVVHGILREFLGPQWHPVSVCFSHGPPADCTVHERLFGVAPQFDHPFTGVVLYSADLSARNRMSDPNLRAYAQQFLQSLAAPKDMTTLERVRELIKLFLPAGLCSLTQIARELQCDRRTLHRHLAAHGETFTTILDAVRVELAEQYLLERPLLPVRRLRSCSASPRRAGSPGGSVSGTAAARPNGARKGPRSRGEAGTADLADLGLAGVSSCW